jgi:TM2 domain-containing membrane protein YozV
MFCQKCGTETLSEAAEFCRKCGSRLGGDAGRSARVVVVRSARSPGAAAVLSFFWCGLGQIYNGQIGKGIGMMIAYFISAILIYLLIGLITTPILWIWGMIDAYNTAERLNAQAGLG